MTHAQDLPPSVVEIAEFLAVKAKGYDNHLKWNEQAMFKADLMNARSRWRGVAPEAFTAKLRQEGMREADIIELVDWLKKAQAGRRLVPDRGYRDFVFNPPPEAPESKPWVSSRDW
ncbi:hypothetical protein [Plantactinospora sp. WMMB782]|uniref:hypothetical protein n=1 Tax=Plantactinospora sp. WMMB782 TaxID=3404121 RepID=UPI003B944516